MSAGVASVLSMASVSNVDTTSASAALVELGTEAVKGMSTNDFILAAKIDACEEAMALVVKEAPKKRNWF